MTEHDKRAAAHIIIFMVSLLTFTGVLIALAMFAPVVLAGILFVAVTVAFGWALSFVWRDNR